MRAARVALGICLLAGCGRFSFEEDPPDNVPKLTIEFAGAGEGTVVGPGGLQCSTSCTIDTAVGAAAGAGEQVGEALEEAVTAR